MDSSINKIRSVLGGLLSLTCMLCGINLHAQDSLKYSHFYWTSLGAGPGVTSSVSNYSGINAGISAAFPFKKNSFQIDASVTSPNTNSSLYSTNSVSINIGKIFSGKHFWAGGYVGPGFVFGTKADGAQYRTGGVNIDVPIMLKVGPWFSIGAIGFTNYGVGYNASGVRLSLVIGGDLL